MGNFNRTPAPVGQTFGRWTVIADDPTPRKPRWFYCRCLCGVERRVRAAAIRSGTSRSCGCLSVDTARMTGRTHGLSKTPLYAAWCNMIGRCYNPRATQFDNYGGRGVTVCERWRTTFETFRDDMGATFDPSLFIERRDNNGPYDPGNCYWATRHQQCRNRSTNRWIETVRGRMVVEDIAIAAGISPSTARVRLSKGITGENLFAPPTPRGKRLAHTSTA